MRIHEICHVTWTENKMFRIIIKRIILPGQKALFFIFYPFIYFLSFHICSWVILHIWITSVILLLLVLLYTCNLSSHSRICERDNCQKSRQWGAGQPLPWLQESWWTYKRKWPAPFAWSFWRNPRALTVATPSVKPVSLQTTRNPQLAKRGTKAALSAELVLSLGTCGLTGMWPI